MSSAGILFTDDKNILLLRRAEGSHAETWGLPGGHAKGNESEIETAKRETKEETGLKNIPGECVGKYACDGGEKPFTTFIFRVENQFKCKISKEHSSWGWFPLGELKEQDLHPGLEKSLPSYLNAIRKASKTFKEWLDIRLLEGRI